MKTFLLIFAAHFFSLNAHAEAVSIQHASIALNAHVEKTDSWNTGPVLLITHGTLAHNKMEIISTLQNLFKQQGISSLAINLSYNITNRQGFYDCATAHTHRHSDALDEMGVWLNWLEKQGVKNVVLLGHSRGGNQTAWFAAERDHALVSQVVLIAPLTWSLDYERTNYKKRFNKNLDPVLQQAQNLIAENKNQQLINPVDFLYCKDTRASAEAVLSYHGDEPKLDAIYWLDKIKKPLLVVAASKDETVKDLDTLLPPLAEKHKFQLAVIDGADHFFLDLYSDDMVERIIHFLTE